MSKNLSIPRKLCVAAVMAALFVVLDMLSIKIGQNIKITFGGLPIIVAAIFGGPVIGLLTGLVGAFIGQLISYGLSVTTVIWIIPAGVRGLAMGLLFIAFRRRTDWVTLGIEIVISSLIVTVLNTAALYIDSLIYGYYSAAVVFGATVFRIASSVLTSAVYVLVIAPIVAALKKK